jgi:hypothetical protein
VNLIRESPEDVPLVEEMLAVISDSSEEAFALAAELLSFTRNSVAIPTILTTGELFQALRGRMKANWAGLEFLFV